MSIVCGGGGGGGGGGVWGGGGGGDGVGWAGIRQFQQTLFVPGCPVTLMPHLIFVI